MEQTAVIIIAHTTSRLKVTWRLTAASRFEHTGKMTVLLDPSILSDLETCRTRLGKKATFEKAIVDTCLILHTHTAQLEFAPVQSKLMEVCARCMTLLKARYTAAAFWRAGDEMLAECQVSCLTRTSQRGA